MRTTRHASPLRCCLAGFCLLGAAVLSAPDAAAQSDASCIHVLPNAESDYYGGRYDAAVRTISRCLQYVDNDPEAVAKAYRLMSLSYLKLDDVASARDAVLGLLSEQPEYETDPVTDLPPYRALVEIVRSQLDLNATQAPDSLVLEEPAAVEPAPAVVRPGRLHVTAAFGVSGYGGERGTETESWTTDFRSNAGPALALRTEYRVLTSLFMGIGYARARYPTILTEKDFKEGALDGDISSTWVHSLTAGLRARVRTAAWLHPYLAVGVVTTLHRLNGRFRSGAGPTFTAGFDVRVHSALELFAEGEAMMVFPGDALDLVDHSSPYDPVGTLSAGFRYRLPGFRR